MHTLDRGILFSCVRDVQSGECSVEKTVNGSYGFFQLLVLRALLHTDVSGGVGGLENCRAKCSAGFARAARTRGEGRSLPALE